MAEIKLKNSFLDVSAKGQKVLVIVPHEDDEINVAGSVMYSYVQKGADVYCVFTTIEVLEKALGKTAEKEYLPMQPGDVYQTYADVSELQRDFDFKPETPIEEGLGKFAEWYRSYYKL